MKERIARALTAREGPMTSELVLHPGGFGLGRVPARLTPAGTARSVCGFCSTGCSLTVHLDRTGQAINLTPDANYPVNLGMACPKGWEALTPLGATDRGRTPLLRNQDNGQMEAVSWTTALDTFVNRFKDVQSRHGRHAVAVLSTGQITTEEMALLGAVTKFGMGLLHLDSNTRQCMATSHVAYRQSFGFDAPPYTYADFEESDALVFIGSNPCIAHPIMWQRVMRNPHNPEIVVIDPRVTETAMAATLHVPLRPKSDLVLLYGIARGLLDRGAVDRAFVEAHTTRFGEFCEFLKDYPRERIVRDTALPASILDRLIEIIATRKRVSFWWTMGVNQGHESTRTAQAIINLALMTGNIGRPGTGANSITGQCNAMGSRLFGNASSLLGGYDFASPRDRSHVASILGISPESIPAEKSLAYDEIIDGIDQGAIRGLWVIATNTAHSWINQSRFAALRDKLDFLVVQDMYPTTETARLADLVLPAAGWGEKDGVLINSERRLGVINKVSRAPGDALSDFSIFKLVAEHWGCGKMFAPWTHPEAAFGILQELSRGQPCDFSGIEGYAHIETAGGIQWPYAKESEVDAAQLRERRLFSDGRFFTPDHRAVFHFENPRPMPEQPDDEYPFLLLTGRGSSSQWHTGSRTDKSEVLRRLAPTALYVELHPADASRLNLENNDRVTVRSRRGAATAFVVVTPNVQSGQIFMPMHFAQVNRLTFPSFDPYSRQPSYKACAVRIDRAPKRDDEPDSSF